MNWKDNKNMWYDVTLTFLHIKHLWIKNEYESNHWKIIKEHWQWRKSKQAHIFHAPTAISNVALITAMKCISDRQSDKKI